MDYSFPKTHRLRTPEEYKRVWSKGRRLSGQLVSVANCSNDLDHARIGLSLSKKQFKRAVDRNRIKRLARETFRHHHTSIKGKDVIILAYKGFETLSPHEQHERFEVLWKKLATICNKHA